MSKVAYLDGDIVVWKAAVLSTSTFEMDDETVAFQDMAKAWAIASKMVEKWCSAVDADEYVFCVSDRSPGGESFRYRVDDNYHANRKSMVRPPKLLDLHWRMVAYHDGVYRAGLEGDDILGILATQCEEDAVVVSEDKDVWSIPKKVYFPTRSKEPTEVTEVLANKYWFYQALIGDPADGYKGCPGVGDKRARKFLSKKKTIEELWEATLAVFTDRGCTEEYALQQVRLARILRTEDIDEDWTKIRLWSPGGDDWMELPEDEKPKESCRENEAAF